MKSMQTVSGMNVSLTLKTQEFMKQCAQGWGKTFLKENNLRNTSMSNLCTVKLSLPLWLCLPTPENPRWGPEKWETGWTPTWAHNHYIDDHMTLKIMSPDLMRLRQNTTHTLSSTSSAMRRISKSTTIFPECSRAE